MQTKGKDPIFIDLDLNRVPEEKEEVKETPADVVPTKETPVIPTVTPPVPADVTPPVKEVIPAEPPVPAGDTPPAPAGDIPPAPAGDTPPAEGEDEDPETVLKKALGLVDEGEKILDKMPESPEKDALSKKIDEQQAIIEKILKEKDEIAFQKETGEIEKNELKRLYGNLDEDDNLKQLLLYSNKAKSDDTFKEKKLNVLKEMLKIEGYDIEELDKLKLEKEKSSMGGAESSKMTVDYKGDAAKDGFIPL